jgi:D-glycero-D-manno-heptose 1,7-bisphosphate phosphatase
MSGESLRVMTDRIMATLPVDAVRVCPHDDRDEWECRKPKPGMLVELAREHDLELGESYLIGDSWKDTFCGWRSGMPIYHSGSALQSRGSRGLPCRRPAKSGEIILGEAGK